jgi:hypothetical protein
LDSLRIAFLEGGWGMYPTLILGTLALALAIRHAMRPKKELLPLIIGVGTSTLFAGWLGMVIGVMTTIRYVQKVPPPERIDITMIGVRESMNNIALALLLAMLIALAGGIGSWRQRRFEQ